MENKQTRGVNMQTNKQRDFANQGDTISRQAAIDAIRGWVKKAFEDWGNAETEIRCFNAIYPLIMALPSAQPQDVFEFDKTYPLAGLQLRLQKVHMVTILLR